MLDLVRNAEFASLVALRRARSLSFMGCRFERGLVGSVSVLVSGKVVGAWWHDGIKYCFSNPAYRAVLREAGSPEDVVAETIAIAAAHQQQASR